jgi:hypothetical protein
MVYTYRQVQNGNTLNWATRTPELRTVMTSVEMEGSHITAAFKYRALNGVDQWI